MKIRKYITYLGVITVILYLLWFCIFKLYPNYLREIYLSYSANLSTGQDYGYNIGTFGDMYGALNSFVSAIAFLGLLVTILLQIYIHKKEITRAENEKFQDYYEKMIYLNSSLSSLLDQIETLMKSLDSWKSSMINKPDSVEILNFELTYDSSIFEEINNKIDQQLYFTAYFQFCKDTEVIEVFQILKQIGNQYKSFISLHNQYEAYFHANIIDHRDYKIICSSQILDNQIRKKFNDLPTVDNGDRQKFIKLYFEGKNHHPNFSKPLSKLFALDFEFKEHKFRLIEKSTLLINQLNNKYNILLKFHDKLSKAI